MKKTYYTGELLFTGSTFVKDFAILTEGAKIASLGTRETIPCPPDAERVRLPGVTTPGLIDCHVHLLCSDLFIRSPTSAEIANMICRGVYHARQLLEAGVVACRDLGSVNGYALGLRDAICAGSIPGPLVQACGLAVCATGGHGGAIGLECDGADAMTRGVRQIVKAGADVVKIMVSGGVNSPGPEPGPCELTETELQAAVDAAHAMGRKVAIHAHGVTAIRRGIWCGVDSVEHGVFMSEEIMDEMRRRGAYLVPTLSAPYYAVEEGLRREPNNPDHLRSKSVVQRHRDMLKKCAERGVNIAFGTDAGNTYDPFDKAYYELVLMVEAGLTPEQAFTAASVGSAALMGISDRLGELAAGKDATFLCWADGDPFKNINYVTGKKHLILNGTRLY